MKHISRRDFIHAGCAIASSTFISGSARAWFHGSVGNNNRITLNVGPNAWANFAKDFGFAVPPASADANGYPTGVLGSNIGINPAFSIGYFGDHVWSWSGIGSMQIAQACLIRSTNAAGVVTGVAGTSGDTAGNTTISGKTAPRVQFAFGGLIQGMSAGASNGSGGNFIRVTFKTNFVNNFSGSGSASSRVIKIQNSVQSGNISGQANSIDTWNYNVVDGSNIDLTTSTTTGAVSVFNSGSPWVSGGEGITTPNNLTILYLAATFTSFTNLVVCQLANETPIANGQIWDPVLVAQYQSLMNHATAPFSQRGWLRFMDSSGVQASFECDFANRLPATYSSYTSGGGALAYFPAAYQAGTITNTSDALTCSNPPGSGGGAYADLEIVQGTVSAANTTANPTLNVGARGAKPVFDFTTNPFIFRFSGPPASAGLNMVFTFSATWLNGGSSYAFTYTTVSADTGSIAALNGNLVNALIADATLAAAKILFGNSGQVTAYPRTAEAGVLTITYTSGPAICTMTRIDPGNLASGTATFIYNKVLDGWIYRAGGLTVSIPFEAIVDLCNRVGAHCWYNWPVYTKATFITAVTNFFGDATTGLTSGLRLGTEVGNELWNFSQGPFSRCLYLAAGIGIYPGGNNAQQWSWGALRSIQYGSLAKAAWTGKGRNASDYYVLNMGNQPSANPGQAYQQYALEGFALTTSNLVYNAWSGLAGGLAPADYSVSGSRPADKYLTSFGMATYWFSDYVREVEQEIQGSVIDNSNWLQASKDYANGNTATAFSALATMFNTQRGSASIVSGSYNNSTGALTLNLSAPINAGTAAPGDITHLYGLTGTGAFAPLNNNGFSAISPTSGTTITLNVTAGRGSLTITGGQAVDETASGVNPGQASNWVAFAFCFANMETIAETYDATRAANSLSKLGIMHYEGAPQWSVGNSALNGTNGTGSAFYTDLANQITSLGWNVSAYTVSGINTATEAANQVVNMIQGWKHDTDRNGNPANTGSYKSMIKSNYYSALVAASAGKGREIHPAQFGYQGNIWGLFPVSFSQGNQYTNYDAIHEFNA